MNSSTNTPEKIDAREKKILAFWDEQKIFKQSEKGVIQQRSWIKRLKRKLFGAKPFVFYDGPPFATGLPHYGHVLASAVKDAIPRYKTMQGHIVRRRWGWDCHGLPLEVMIEKEIGTKTKQDIERYGIERFNAKAREAILRYANEWKKFIPRIGRWVDMENDYRTVDTSYTESVWNVFQRLHKRGVVSEGSKSLHLCPRCATTLSNNEVSDGYADVEDIAVYVLFPLTTDKNTFFVAWTTTPWTLLGNVALALHRDLIYAVVQKDGKRYILNEDKVDIIEGGKIVEKKKGKEFVGQAYETIFPMLYRDDSEEIKKKIWKVHHAEYVDASVGTGIVHLSPAYGAEDMVFAQELGLPIRHHVTKDGVFVEKLGAPFKGLRPKEKGNPKKVDTIIINEIISKGRLLKDEKITHSYPLCWRCDTPLLNYATNSWFVHTEKYTDAMVKENKKVGWTPLHIRDGRFGNWLAQSRPWAVSRSRFWGAPLPVWKVKQTGENIIVGSLEEMMNKMKPRNKYILVRHGKSQSNIKGTISTKISSDDTLTDLGTKQAQEVAQKLRTHKPTVIISSPLTRTKHTAEIIAKINKQTLKTTESVTFDEGITELQIEHDTGEKWSDVERPYVTEEDRHQNNPIKTRGETFFEMFKRLTDFMEKIDKRYEGERIVVVTHSVIISALLSLRPYLKETIFTFTDKDTQRAIPNAKPMHMSYLYIKRDEKLDVDLHRPYIDKVKLYDENGNKAEHIKDVFDCWFESGAMPYGSNHYPFENNKTFNPEKRKGFPADFIAEAEFQTRGWFYTLMAIGVGAFDRSPYKQVIVTGVIRAADGKKMSKRLKNYTDPMEIVKKYGADALRHYLLGSPVVRGNDLDFQDSGVEEIYKKVYTRLHNCLTFYKTYAHLPHKRGVKQPLDRYILSRLAQTCSTMTENLNSYQLDKAVQPIGDFVEDLSIWYLRRSRDVLRSNTVKGAQARETLRSVLSEFAKCIAPIAPFYAEYMYRDLRNLAQDTTTPISVHLCSYPKAGNVHTKIIEEMNTVRKIVSSAHDKRSAAGIKVRQPLQRLTVNTQLSDYAKEIIAEEVNVKEVITVRDKDGSNNENMVALDTAMTDALRDEGFAREIVRALQSERKKQGFQVLETLLQVLLFVPQTKHRALNTFNEKIKNEVRTERLTIVETKPDNATLQIIDGEEVAFVLERKK